MSKSKLILIILAGLLLIALSRANAQNVEWMHQYNSQYDLVDFGRHIKSDPNGNVYIAGHSFYNEEQKSVIRILKYNPQGEIIWDYESQPDDLMNDFTIDANGNCYSAGEVWNDANEFDIKIIKVNGNDGNTSWVKTIPELRWQRLNCITTDVSGNIYTAGYTWDIATNGYNMMLMKLSPAGDILWTKTYTTNTYDYCQSIKLDADNNILITGYSGSSLFVLKYSDKGEQLWIKTTETNKVRSEVTKSFIDIDAQNNIAVCGNYQSAATGSDVMVIKYSAEGDELWKRYWRGLGNDSDRVSSGYYNGDAMLLDGSGNIVVTATTSKRGVLFSEDVVIFKFSSTGDSLWTYRYNGAGNDTDMPHDMKVSKETGDIYVTGKTCVVNNSLVPYDYLTMKVSRDGAVQWLKTFNGPGDFGDEAHGLALDQRDNVYVTGLVSLSQDIFSYAMDIVTIKYSNDKSTSVITSANTIDGFRLNQNYPNPFNPSTVISYRLEAGSNVSLKVFDLTGREIATLVNGRQNVGTYSIDFNASELTSGTYIYRLEANGRVETRKMVLVK